MPQGGVAHQSKAPVVSGEFNFRTRLPWPAVFPKKKPPPLAPCEWNPSAWGRTVPDPHANGTLMRRGAIGIGRFRYSQFPSYKSSFTAQGIPRERIQPPPRRWVVYSDSRQVSQILSQVFQILSQVFQILSKV